MGLKVTNNAFDTANKLEIVKVTARTAEVRELEPLIIPEQGDASS